MQKSKPKLVVLSGAGISAESGLKTFRDADGLWEGYNVYEVATPRGFAANPQLVLDFYNMRRNDVANALPNAAHIELAKLESDFDVTIITQNIDDLHERAGSKQVLHLHGEIMKGRSTAKQELVYPLKHWEIKAGDVCEVGSQIRPHIVWFGEAVPEMDKATEYAEKADVFITIGTSLNVYPAANLINVIEGHIPKFLVDPGDFNLDYIKNLTIVKATAIEGMKVLSKKLNELI